MANGNSSRTYQWVIGILVAVVFTLFGVVFGRGLEGGEVREVRVELKDTSDRSKKNEIVMQEYIKNTDLNISEIKKTLDTIRTDIKDIGK